MSMDTAPESGSSIEASNALLLRPGRLQELVRGVSWMRELDSADVEALLRDAKVNALRGREWLYRQDTPADWLYIVISGAVRLVRSTAEGRLATIRCVERGDALGHLSMVASPGIYLYSAETLRRTQVLAIRADQCRQFMSSNPACRAEFMSRMALELTNRVEDLALMTQGDAMVRLVSYILRELPPAQGSEPRVVRLTIPKRWLAAQLAMTPETLSRLLSKLRESGAINVDRQRLEVLDEPQLRAIMLTVE
ncbi:MAG TPA: Crp/Fnr family transcriptional regulator [Halomonas sp.]|nr:Crp/Fnr family transcriptional regulator [Halomonas sp.]